MVKNQRIKCALFISLSILVSAASTFIAPSAIQLAKASGLTYVITSASDAIVGTCPDAAICTLRAAINAANVNAGSSITFDPTVFANAQTITLGSTLPALNASMTITGPGASLLTISGNNAVEVIIINKDITISISNVTIANGNSGAGGGILNYHATLTIADSTFSGNSASGGGGGGIENYYAKLTIANSTFSGNSATNGGNGGGVANDSGTLTIANSTFSNNFATRGGGILNNTTLNLANSTLSGNSATNGGGIENNGTLNLANSTLSGNSATNGGGIDNSSGTLTIANSTLSGNSATNGGGINNNGTLNLANSIIAKGAQGGDCLAFGGTIGLSNNLLDDRSCGNTTANGVTNLSTILANNGGPTQTLALLAGSDAINAVTSCTYPAGFPTVMFPGTSVSWSGGGVITTDQRGYPRPYPQCDVGAFEYTPPPTATPTATLTITPSATLTPSPSTTLTVTPSPTLTPSATLTSMPSVTPTNTPTAPPIDTIGVYRNGTFLLRLSNSTGYADLSIVAYRPGSKSYPIVGDWTGSGFDRMGTFDQDSGMFALCTVNNALQCNNPNNVLTLVLGVAGDMPLAGRWQADATHASVGVFRPSNGLIYLKNELITGYADYTMVLGLPGDIGLAGDWTGKGYDSPGVYRPSYVGFFMSNQVTNGRLFGDFQFLYGYPGDSPVVGDWSGQGHDGVGLFRPTNGYTYLRNSLTTGYADNMFVYGIAGDIPVAGHWRAIYSTTPNLSHLIIGATPAATLTSSVTLSAPRTQLPGGFDG